jgi:hypothetical protein
LICYSYGLEVLVLPSTQIAGPGDAMRLAIILGEEANQ